MTYYQSEIEEIMNRYTHLLSEKQSTEVYLRLDQALTAGRKAEYQRILGYVAEGIFESATLAREIAEQYGFSTERLDNILSRKDGKGYLPLEGEIITPTNYCEEKEEKLKIPLSVLEEVIREFNNPSHPDK